MGPAPSHHLNFLPKRHRKELNEKQLESELKNTEVGREVGDHLIQLIWLPEKGKTRAQRGQISSQWSHSEAGNQP